MRTSVSRAGTRLGPARWIPLAYFALALALIVALMPSALRPPPDPANTAAEFSPDAPPDDQEAIVAALGRGVSGTAGSGQGQGATPGDSEPVLPELLPPEAPAPPSACPFGFGDPPRQVEYLYAPPCAAPFAGDNGGETYQGVTAAEIRVGVRGTGSRGGSNNCSRNGPIEESDAGSAYSFERTMWAMQQYFNQTLQLYGRQVRLYCIDPGGATIEDEQAMAEQADNEYKLFGTPTSTSVVCQEWARRKIVAWCEGLTAKDYADKAPYLWSGWFEGTEGTRIVVEYLCKKLANKPAQFAGDPTMHEKQRKFGLLFYDTRGYDKNGAFFKDRAKQQCGIDIVAIGANADNADGRGALAQAVTRFRAEDVTTVVPYMDWISTAVLTNTAESQAYFPEWVATDAGGVSNNQLGRLMNQNQWRHAFGLSGEEIERPKDATSCHRAYHAIDADRDPNEVFCRYQWKNMALFMSGLQLAGPSLTPQSFAEGWFRRGMKFWDGKPSWAIGGGFAPGVMTYPHDVGEIWWDAAATTPDGQLGAYQWTNKGKRWRESQLTEELVVFSDGIVVPEDWAEPG